MDIKPTDRKTYEVIRQKLVQATIRFPSIWKQRAEVSFRGGGQLSINPVSSWKQQYQAELNGQIRGELKIHWTGKAFITLYESTDQPPVKYLIKKKSAWGYDYNISKDDGPVFLRLKSKWSWRKFSFSYTVEELEILEDPFKLEMLAYTVFIHRIHMQQSSAA